MCVGGESVLQPDLQSIVEEDNAAFRQEIVEYDARKERERLREVSLRRRRRRRKQLVYFECVVGVCAGTRRSGWW